jgi:hypothetical protein
VTLSELQALLHGRITGVVPDREAELREQVQERPALPALERVEIYARMYLHRLVDAVAEDVPHTAGMLGHDRFVDLVREYLREHPSRSPDIGQVGRHFGAWLRGQGGFRDDLPDLAILERTRSEVRTTPDAPVAAAGTLQALPTEALPETRFVFSPSLRVLHLHHDVRALWDALDENQDERPAPAPGPTTLAVWRQEFKVFHTALSASEADALEVAREGGTLEDVCAACAGEPEPAHAAFRTVLSWFADGWVAAVMNPDLGGAHSLREATRVG